MAEVAKYKLKATGQQVDEAVAKRTQVLDSAPTSETVGVVGGMAVIGNSLYVCTAVTEVEGEPTTYTWLKVKGIVDIVQTTGILKGDGDGNAVQAVEGTDYQGALTSTQLDNIDKLNGKTIATTLGNNNNTIPTSKAVRDAFTAVGDMTKAMYDTNNNGIVDNAEKVEGMTIAEIEADVALVPPLAGKQISFPSASYWKGNCYGCGKYIIGIVGSSSYIYSDDGVTWIASNSLPASGNWTFAGSPSRIVAVCSSGAIAYSTDGVNWTTSSTTVSNFYDIAYGGGKFVITANKKIMYSVDGNSWTTITQNNITTNAYIAYGAGRFVIVQYASTGSAYFFSSTDGMTWESASVANAIAKYAISIFYLHERFIVVGDTTLAMSVDGLIWRTITISTNIGTFNNRNIIIAGINSVIAITSNSSKGFWSYDGFTWNTLAQLAGSTSIQAQNLLYGNKKFILPFYGQSQGYLLYA